MIWPLFLFCADLMTTTVDRPQHCLGSLLGPSENWDRSFHFWQQKRSGNLHFQLFNCLMPVSHFSAPRKSEMSTMKEFSENHFNKKKNYRWPFQHMPQSHPSAAPISLQGRCSIFAPNLSDRIFWVPLFHHHRQRKIKFEIGLMSISLLLLSLRNVYAAWSIKERTYSDQRQH